MSMVQINATQALPEGVCSLRLYDRSWCVMFSRADYGSVFDNAERVLVFTDPTDPLKMGFKACKNNFDGTSVLDRRAILPRHLKLSHKIVSGRYRLEYSEADGMHVINLSEPIG